MERPLLGWTSRLALLLLAGCGGNDPSRPSDPSASASSTGAFEPPRTTSTSAVETGDSTGASTQAGASTQTDASTMADASTTTSSALDTCGNAPGQLLLPDMPWNRPIVADPIAADSAAVIDYLQANVDSDARFQIDFSIAVLEATASTERRAFEPTEDFFEPDCDPAAIPVPADGHLEGEPGYACASDGDCHLIVLDRAACRLYEQWRANLEGEAFSGGCLAVWELDHRYGEALRGEACTSADAAGLPIAPLLFDADEIAAGRIEHAIRFIVPNEHIRADLYVRPATHSTPATSGPAEAPPYGARLRLRADADLEGLNPAARVVAEAMQTYGIILADAGNLTFTAASDDFTASTWSSVGLGPHDLKDLQWSDFEVVDGGTPISWSGGSCERAPLVD